MEEEPRIGDCYKLAAVEEYRDGARSSSATACIRTRTFRSCSARRETRVRERLQAGPADLAQPDRAGGQTDLVHRRIGSEPLMADVILERAREMAGE